MMGRKSLTEGKWIERKMRKNPGPIATLCGYQTGNFARGNASKAAVSQLENKSPDLFTKKCCSTKELENHISCTYIFLLLLQRIQVKIWQN